MKAVKEFIAVFMALLLTILLAVIFYALLHATGDLPTVDRGYYRERSRVSASLIVNNLRSLKAGTLVSLTDGNELPLDMFSSRSPAMSNKLEPYMDRSLDRAIVVLSTDRALKTVRSPDALPPSLYAGFYGFYEMGRPANPRTRGFFTRLLDIEQEDVVRLYRGYLEKMLANMARDAGLYKNVQGEPYDGGDMILMKVF